MSPSAIHWFRKGLRLHDNPAFLSAVSSSHLELRPIFILDPWFVSNCNVGINRWRFLQQSLQDLDTQLRALGSRLFVVRGNPKEVLPRLFKDWQVEKLTFEVDSEPYAVQRDAEVEALAKTHNVEVDTRVSHTLYNLQAVIQKNKGSPPLTYQSYLKLAGSLGPPAKPVSFSGSLPPSVQTQDKKDLARAEYDVPTLKELGVDEQDLEECLYVGGETEGLKRLEKYICENNSGWVCKFEKPNTSPNSLKPSTTVLSPYLKFGCVSPRLMFLKLDEILSKNSKHSQPPVSLVGQLYWREFFYTCGAGIKNFDQMKDNSVCRQIPWDSNPSYLAAWKSGRTGYPFVDAIMTQLRKEGWIHHLARHSVACFLTRGDLYLSWEDGMKVFEEYLLDQDWSLNAGNWMWLSASAFFHQYYRVYSPVAFGKKTDPSGAYIKKYLPILKKFPDKYIYEPWKAPLAMQKAAGCVIGQDYPRPIVDHDSIHKVNIGRHKAAYAKAKSESGQAQQSPEKKNNSSSKAKSSQSGKRKSETSSQSTSKITKFFAKK